MLRRVAALGGAVLMLGCLLAGCSPSAGRTESSSDSSSGASDVSSIQPTDSVRSFALSYSNTDTLNPYTAKTRDNLNICSLLYEGLTSFDNAMTPVMCLASSVDKAETTLTATLRGDARFTDGSAVTTDDVVSSFALARTSSAYGPLLSNVASAEAGENNTVVFTLSSPDPNALACLSFPVIKKDTDASPVGSGRYVFRGGDTPVLESNPAHAAQPSIATIALQDVQDEDAKMYMLESNNISFFYSDLSDGNIPSTTKACVSIPLNYLVFLGVNAGREGLSSKDVRSALSAAVNRTEICANAFTGRAQPAAAPFCPTWAAASALTGFDNRENLSSAVAQLQSAGYNDTSGTSPQTLSLELLVSEGNSFRDTAADLLVSQLSKAGITLTVTTLPFSEYSSRLKRGSYDLYLGEIRLSANMSLRPMLTSGGSASYGVDMNGQAVASYQQYMQGSATLEDFSAAFAADVPYIPLCWRNGMAAYDRTLAGVSPTAFDVFYGIDSWSFS